MGIKIRIGMILTLLVMLFVFTQSAHTGYGNMKRRDSLLTSQFRLLKHTLILPCDQKIKKSKKFKFDYKTLNNKRPKYGFKHNLPDVFSKNLLPTMWEER